jgi:hypothetical protein
MDEISNEDFVKQRGDKTDREISKKFSQTDWNAIEQPASNFVKEVINVLTNMASDNDTDTDTDTDTNSHNKKYSVMGEYFYNFIRKSLSMYGMVDENIEINIEPNIEPNIETESNIKTNKKSNKKANKKDNKSIKLSKVDEIRMKSTSDKIGKYIKNLLDVFLKSKEMRYSVNTGQYEYIEIHGITLMYCAWFITLKEPTKYRTDKYREDVYEVIVAIQKFLNSSIGLKGSSILNKATNENISITMQYDLRRWLDKLTNFVSFDGFLLIRDAPRLLIYTKFDKVIPSSGIKPRNNQIQLVKLTKENIQTGFFISLKAMLSSGKTTSATVCLSQIINDLNNDHNMIIRKQLIFTCNNNAVRLDVARIAYNAEIKFGIASIDSERGLRITNHFNTTESNRILIIASPEAARELLIEDYKRRKIYGESERYWLFLDEPTIGADNLNSQSLYENMSLFPYIPKHTVICSATMCELTEIPTIINYIIEMYPGIYIDTIYSNEIQIGCDIKTFDKKRVIPYAGCSTSEELLSVIRTVEKNPFLGRAFTTLVAHNLWIDLVNKDIENLPDIREQFADVTNLSLDKVRILCMKFLNILSTQSDEIIATVCQNSSLFVQDPLPNININKKKSDDMFIRNDQVIQNVPNEITFNLFGTTQAYKFLGMNLIIDSNPIEFVCKNFKNLIDIFNNSGIKAFDLDRKYEEAKKDHEKSSERIQKRIKREDEKSKQQQELDGTAPKLDFPAYLQINTADHIKHFAGLHLDEIENANAIRVPLILDNIPFIDFQVDDWMILLLYAGVGIIYPNITCNTYNSLVSEYASNGQLAFVIGDETVGYGTNNPFVRVFLTNNNQTEPSINTIFQNMGRAGRVGQSWKAEAYVDDSIANMILEYVKDPDNFENAKIESRNMEMVFNRILDEKNQASAHQEIKTNHKSQKKSGGGLSCAHIGDISLITTNTNTNITIPEDIDNPIISISAIRPDNDLVANSSDSHNWRSGGNKFTETVTEIDSNPNISITRLNHTKTSTYVPPHKR